MKSFGKIFLTLLLLLLLVIISSFFLVQTYWGAEWISRWVSNNTHYYLSVAKVEHHFSKPSQLILHNVTFGHDDQPAVLIATRIDLHFSAKQFKKLVNFKKIELSNGSLNVFDNSIAWPLQAGRLQLSNIAIVSPRSKISVEAQQVSGTVAPWKPSQGNVLGQNANFKLKARTVAINDASGKNIVLEGRVNSQFLALHHVSADVLGGSIIGSATRNVQGHWHIERLCFNNIRLQTSYSLNRFLQPLISLSSTHFDQLDVSNARLQGPEWAVNDLNLSLKNLTLRNGNWESDQGSLLIQASSVIQGQLELDDPIVQMTFSSQGITIPQLSARWSKGVIRTRGNWLHSTQRLNLHELEISGLEYTLPADWQDLWMKPLPEWLDSVMVSRFTTHHNLLIDINPVFPFEITSLEGDGNNLLVADAHQWGIWSGTLNVHAVQATFNRTDLRDPSLILTANDQKINLTKISASVGGGILEGFATLSQQPTRALSLTLSGKTVSTNLLHNWGWPAVSLQGVGHIQLNFNANLAVDTPFSQYANGTLSVNAKGQSMEQNMMNGVVHP